MTRNTKWILGFVALTWLQFVTVGLSQQSYTVTVWGIRFHYKNGTTDVSTNSYESETAALQAGAKAKADWNAAFAGDMIKYKPYPIQETRTPARPGASPPALPPLQLPSRPGTSTPTPAPPSAEPSLQGKTLVGSENLGGYGRLQFRFLPMNRVEMIDAQQTVVGSWYQSGSKLTLLFWNGKVSYSGSINGNTISGTAENGRDNWSWNVRR